MENHFLRCNMPDFSEYTVKYPINAAFCGRQHLTVQDLIQDCQLSIPSAIKLADDIHLASESSARSLRSSSRRKCSVTHVHSRFGDRCFAAAGPRIWNNLPASLRDNEVSCTQFRRQLKTFMFQTNCGASCFLLLRLILHTLTYFFYVVWRESIRYLGVYLVSSKSLKCSLSNFKRSFYRSFHAIFGKVGRLAAEPVTVELLKSKSLPSLYYGLEACPLSSADFKSLEYVVVGACMKIFNTRSKEVVTSCMEMFNFPLPSVCISNRKSNFLRKLSVSDNIIYRPCAEYVN